MSEDNQDWLRFDFYPTGAELMRQGARSGSLIVLKEGEIEVLRDGAYVSSTRQPGSIFGEMSVLLDKPHSATVRAVTDVQIFVIDDALKVLQSHPSWLMQIARLLAQRVNATTAQLVEARAGDAPEPEPMVLPSTVFSSWSDPQI
ncbi:Crp/Fnr family transcriptional regulator [Devosia sp.]|uniref:Crp/Fnr family transcriptional regulator n=1 Tax=Devosia sp. TaxID=1871048 RepID=UPI003A9091C4